jgi:hypothetical protein
VLAWHRVGDVACGDSLLVGARGAISLVPAAPRRWLRSVRVVAGEGHRRPDPPPFRQLLAGDTPVQHGRLSHHRTVHLPNLSVRSSVGARASRIFRLGQLVAELPHSFHLSR